MVTEQYHTIRSVLSQQQKSKILAKDKRTSVYYDHQSNAFVGLKDVDLQRLKETYKDIDVDKELNKMGLWLSSSKGKSRVGSMTFILHWLENARPTVKQPFHSTGSENFSPEDLSLSPSMVKYLEDLWKPNEHLFALNRMP